MISPYKFVWDDISSLEFDVLTDLAFDSDNGTVETHLSREAVVSETYNGAFKRAHGYKWNDNFTFQLTLIKKDFGDFSPAENRKILRWLTSRQTAGYIDIYKDDSNAIEFSALGNFVNVSQYKLGNGRVVGYVADWESLMPYAVRRQSLEDNPVTIIDPTNNKITITVDTDEPLAPVYPYIKVTHLGVVVKIPTGTKYNVLSDMVPNTVYDNGSTYYWKSEEKASSATKPTYNWEIVLVDGTNAVKWEKDKIYYDQNAKMYYWVDPYYFHEKSHTANEAPPLSTTSVRIRNKNTEFLTNDSEYTSTTVVRNSNSSEVITIDGANKIISSNSVNRIFGDDFNWEWPELYDDKNEIIIEGNCKVEIFWIEPYKAGEF